MTRMLWRLHVKQAPAGCTFCLLAKQRSRVKRSRLRFRALCMLRRAPASTDCRVQISSAICCARHLRVDESLKNFLAQHNLALIRRHQRQKELRLLSIAVRPSLTRAGSHKAFTVVLAIRRAQSFIHTIARLSFVLSKTTQRLRRSAPATVRHAGPRRPRHRPRKQAAD